MSCLLRAGGDEGGEEREGGKEREVGKEGRGSKKGEEGGRQVGRETREGKK